MQAVADSLNLRTLTEATNSVLQNRMSAYLGEMHFVSTSPSLFERNANHSYNVIILRFYQLAFLVSLCFNSSSKPHALRECLFLKTYYLAGIPQACLFFHQEFHVFLPATTVCYPT